MIKIIISIIIVVIVCAGLGYWAYSLWNAPVVVDTNPGSILTPEERKKLIEDLEKASAPVPTVSERETVIKDLEAVSAPVSDTRDERIEQLKALEAASAR